MIDNKITTTAHHVWILRSYHRNTEGTAEIDMRPVAGIVVGQMLAQKWASGHEVDWKETPQGFLGTDTVRPELYFTLVRMPVLQDWEVNVQELGY